MTETGTTAPATLMMTATHGHYSGPAVLQHVYFTARFSTESAAESFSALFPKSAQIRVEAVHSSYTNSTVNSVEYYQVKSVNTLLPNARNGKLNEAGVKRVRAILARAEKHGIEVQYAAEYANSYPSRKAFEAALAAIEATV